MSLTAAAGPFGRQPSGRFNFPVEPATGAVIYWQPVPQRIRAVVGGEAVVDTRRAHLLHETGHLPVYYFPPEDVREDLLERTDRTTHCPHKGDASYWTIRAGRRSEENAVWSYERPLDPVAFIAGYRALYWHVVDEWFAEDEQMFGHPRDPFHRIDVYRSTAHVRVSLDGELLADARRARVLYETGLPPRWYLPLEDVSVELLEPSATKTRCAYKGSASYWSVRIADRIEDDLLWTYADPQHDAEPVRDLVCFFNERVDLEIDGEALERPRTQWSR